MKTIVLMAVAGLFATHAFYVQTHQDKPAGVNIIPVIALTETRENENKAFVTNGEVIKVPVKFTSVTLVHKATGEVIDTPLTDSKLKLSLTGVAPGQYSLLVNFLGYKTRIVDNINISSAKEDTNVGVLLLWMLFL